VETESLPDLAPVSDSDIYSTLSLFLQKVNDTGDEAHTSKFDAAFMAGVTGPRTASQKSGTVEHRAISLPARIDFGTMWRLSSHASS
jgi:hypothetical protein